MIPVKFEDFCMPGWMSMLIGTSTFEVGTSPFNCFLIQHLIFLIKYTRPLVYNLEKNSNFIGLIELNPDKSN